MTEEKLKKGNLITQKIKSIQTIERFITQGPILDELSLETKVLDDILLIKEDLMDNLKVLEKKYEKEFENL